MRFWKRLTLLAMSCSGLAMAQLASAGNISATYVFGYGTQNVNYSANLPGLMGPGNSNATMFQGTRTGGTDTLVSNMFDAFCCEIGQTMGGSGSHPNVFNLLGSSTNTGGISGPVLFDATRTWRLERLWGQFKSAINNTASMAAFQLAQWELCFDDDATLVQNANSKFWVTGPQSQPGITNLAESWLQAVVSNPGGPRSRLLLLTGPSIQDQITLVPEPATLGVLGVGLASLIRKRRARK